MFIKPVYIGRCFMAVVVILDVDGIKTFFASLSSLTNKLERFPLARIFSLVYFLGQRPAPYKLSRSLRRHSEERHSE